MHTASATRSLCAAFVAAAALAVSANVWASDGADPDPPAESPTRTLEVSAPEDASDSATSDSADDPAGAAQAATIPGSRPEDGTPSNVTPQSEEDSKPAASEPAGAQPPRKTGAQLPIDAASFKGVKPGESTRDVVAREWGEPKQVRNVDGASLQTYTIQSFDRVRATIVNDLVTSIVIYLDKPLPPEALAKRLQLADVVPVEVTDDHGRPMGRSFPERGVMFGYAAGSSPIGVAQVLLEPIDAQPFVARAESSLDVAYARSLADLDYALRVDSRNARAQWLRARVLQASGQLALAHQAADQAASLDPSDARYRLTGAGILLASTDVDQARKLVQHIIDNESMPAVVKAEAISLLGKCMTASSKPDWGRATQLQLEAVKLAEPLAADERIAIRREAKQVLLEAHLATAHNIGWGNWQQKDTAVPKWLERAQVLAQDMVAQDGMGEEIMFRVYEQALGALAGLEKPLDPTTWVENVLRLGKKLIEEGDDPAHRQAMAWRLGTALAQAVHLENTRGRADSALAYGDLANTYLTEGASSAAQLAGRDYQIGHLYYLLGNIHATRREDHKHAVTWYDKATPLLEKPVPPSQVGSGVLGDAFVSMAVSYWEVGGRAEAMRLTGEGARLLERGVEEGTSSRSALAVPYANLSNMHKELGQQGEAEKFSKMAAAIEAAERK